jgi:hypothetical protein
VRITSAGNVGIGTSVPTATLDVGGEIKLSSDLYMGNGRWLRFDRNSGSTSIQTLGIPTGTDDVRLLTTGDFNLVTGSLSNLLTVKQAGNVGIGTGAPEALLHVNKSTAGGEGGYIYLDNPAASTLSSNVGIKFGTSGGASFSAVYTGLIQNIVTDGSTGASDLVFGTFDGATSAERVRISAAGNVGIGTSAPAEKLDVIGGALAAGNGTIRTGITYSSLGLLGTFTNHDLGLITNGTEKARITNSGNVGIGTSAPNIGGYVAGNTVLTMAPSGSDKFSVLQLSGNRGFGGNQNGNIDFVNSEGTATITSRISAINGANALDGQIAFETRTAAGSLTERLRITSAGNVGIGTDAPTQKLDVAGRVNAAGSDYHSFSVDQGSAQIRLERTGTSTGVNYIGSDNRGLLITDSAFSALAIFTANGLTFNGDTLAANALDDYEEGTFTPSVAFGGGSTGITYFDQVGNYTKIGRQVFITLYVALTNAGSSTGTATITGLPFTNGNVNRGNQAVGSIRFDNITYTGTPQVYVANSTTSISFQQVTEAGTDALLTEANFNSASEISVSVSYFV